MTKQEVIKQIKQEFLKGVEITLDLDKDDNKYYLDLAIDGDYLVHIEVEKQYKQDTYEYLVQLSKQFDFSYYLEFYTYEELELWIKG